jgi:hypothetical protein
MRGAVEATFSVNLISVSFIRFCLLTNFDHFLSTILFGTRQQHFAEPDARRFHRFHPITHQRAIESYQAHFQRNFLSTSFSSNQ